MLVQVKDDVDLDERPLNKRGIIQLPTLSAIVRPAPNVVVHDGRSFELCGAVIDRRSAPDAAGLDDARRHLLALAAGDRASVGVGARSPRRSGGRHRRRRRGGAPALGG